jgi:hypothetical protein
MDKLEGARTVAGREQRILWVTLAVAYPTNDAATALRRLAAARSEPDDDEEEEKKREKRRKQCVFRKILIKSLQFVISVCRTRYG